jgi:PAS domain S-box-containing protein
MLVAKNFAPAQWTNLPACIKIKFARTFLMKADAALNSQAPIREFKSDIRSLLGSEQLHRTLFDGLPGMAYLGRADRARTIELASAGRHALLGLKPELKSFQLAPLIHPDEREQVLELVKSAVAENRPFAIEYRLRHARGDWRTVWDQGQPFRHGQQIAVQGQLMDVTHRLQLEQARLDTEHQLLQSQKFSALKQLVGGVAHEFNNLIHGLLNSAEVVAIDLPEEHPHHETLKQICLESSNRAHDLAHKIRALEHRPQPERNPLRLQPVIEECLQILRTIIPAKVELETQINPDCPKIRADHAQLHQVMLDLCLHAWQGLADRRGRIKITLENCPFARVPGGVASRLRPGPYVCLTVQDNSPGFDQSECEKYFHPFHMRRAVGKKNGLELFLVRETIQAHQGEIVAESEPGKGLAFHIYLPVAADSR